MNTIRGRLVLILLLTQAVLMPPLLYTIDRIVGHTMSDAFIDDARSYGQVFAYELAASEILGDPRAVIDVLDAAILGGHCVYATLQVNDRAFASTLMEQDDVADFREDFELGENSDDVYYLSVPITGPDHMAVLRLGFDETPVQEGLSDVRMGVLYILLIFAVVSIVFTALVSSTIVTPLKWLQRASRAISSGDRAHELRSTSKLVEIRDLSHDLETMRGHLVGLAERLQEEMKERELAEKERRGLEKFLRQAQRLESLGTLAGGVAHEFNNVLQPILLYTELALKQVEAGSPTAQNLFRVLELARRAKELSRQILTFGQQKERAEFSRCDIREIVYEAVTMIRALLPATVDIRTNLNSDIGAVVCDPAQIKQLVVNLCNNAFHALEGLNDYIEVSLNEVLVPEELTIRNTKLRPGEYVVLQVADTGRGMDEETIERVFEPFFTTREVGEGSGLGLSVVHGIVMQHNSEISVESELGKGTRFRIYMPLSDAAADAISKQREGHGQDTGN